MYEQEGGPDLAIDWLKSTKDGHFFPDFDGFATNVDDVPVEERDSVGAKLMRDGKFLTKARLNSGRIGFDPSVRLSLAGEGVLHFAHEIGHAKDAAEDIVKFMNNEYRDDIRDTRPRSQRANEKSANRWADEVTRGRR